MEVDNPYDPPEAELIEERPGEEGTYFPVSIKKLTALYFLTFGIYLLVWFHENWKRVKLREQSSIWPVPRALFYIFFTHSLFRRIGESAAAQAVEITWKPALQATLVVVLTIAGNVLDRVNAQTDALGLLDLLGMLIFVGLYFPFREVQQTVNRINDDPDGAMNATFSGWNIAFMALGSLIWLLVVVGWLDQVFGFIPEA
jgi:hypothetical protein